MKTRLLIFAVILLPAFGLSEGFSVRNPAIRNPVGIGTAPVSSYRDGLITTSVHIDATADPSITGNLQDGRHFRGNAPYSSASYLGPDTASPSLNSQQGTPSLSSFLRDSAGSGDFGIRSGIDFAARPYLSPTEAAARTVPGRAEVLTPWGRGDGFIFHQNGEQAANRSFTMESTPKQQVTPEQETTAGAEDFRRFYTKYGSMNESPSTSQGSFVRGISAGIHDIERLTPAQVADARSQEDKFALERLREQSRRPLVDPRQASRLEERSDPAWEDGYRSDFIKSPPAGESTKDAATDRFRTSRTESFQTSKGSTVGRDADQSQTGSEREYREVLDRIRQQLDELSRSVEMRLQAGPDGEQQADVANVAETAHIKKSGLSPAAPKPGESGSLKLADSSYRLKVQEPSFGRGTLTTAGRGGAFGQVDKDQQTRTEFPNISGSRTAKEIRALPESFGGLSRAEISHEAKRIIGGHENHDSFAAHKFSRHVREAEDYLRAGKYYKAADSFGLALIYNPDDPGVLAARSHALFAAGEYISSALFLTRALAIDPEYAKVKVDFVTLLGGRNRLAGRIADIEQWLARSGSGRLQLLLGYVYYQTGRLSEAKRAIEAARRKMPRSPAADAIMAALSNTSDGL